MTEQKPLRNNKTLFFNFLYVFLIISLILFMIWIVFYLRSHAIQCLKDPIKYVEDRMDGAECYCMKDGQFILPKEPKFKQGNNPLVIP